MPLIRPLECHPRSQCPAPFCYKTQMLSPHSWMATLSVISTNYFSCTPSTRLTPVMLPCTGCALSTRAHVLVSTTGTSFPFTLPHTNYASSTSRLAFSFWRGTNITTDFCTYHGHQKSYDPFCAVFCFRAPIFSSTRTSIIISIVLELIRSRMDLRT